MKTKLFLSSVVFLMNTLIGISYATEMPKGSSKDGQIIELLVVLDNNEIGAANAALKHTSNPKVKEYAEMIKKEHGENLDKAIALGKNLGVTPTPSHKSDSLKANGSSELKNLSRLKDKSFDKAYINAMIKGHQDAVNLINSQLGQVKDSALKQLLVETKGHVESHLKQAQAIKNGGGV